MKDNVKELTEGMQRLCAIANRIVSHQGEVSQIEKDLLLEDLRRLYDVALRMGESGERKVSDKRGMAKDEPADAAVKMPDEEMLSSTVMATMAAMGMSERREPEPEPAPAPEPAPEPEPEPAPEPEPEPEPEATAVEMPKMEDLEANGNSLLFDEVIIEETPAPEPVKDEEVTEIERTPVKEQQIPETPVKDEEHTEHPVEEATVIEKPAPAETPKAGTQASLLDYLKRPVEEKPTVRTLGDTLGEGIQKSEFGIQNREKVSDLRTVININDKFSFMSELFHGNMKAYNDFILRLNSIDTRDEALLCVNEVSAQYKWDENSLAVQSFYKVFDKKF